MRLKLLRRRLSVSAPRMTVRSHLPWPLRWAALALALGFSAALALWAFEFGREIAGLDGHLRHKLAIAQQELVALRAERDRAQAVANTADSLLKAERATQQALTLQVRALQDEAGALKADLGFFERLLPISGKQGLAVRGMHAEVAGAGQLRYQLLVMQGNRATGEFQGRYELALAGQLDGKGWSQSLAGGGARPIRFKQYQRVEGEIEYPAQAVVHSVEVRILDADGGVRAQQSLRL
jgi:multidrug efflux pump subunit AcrA (membrane-fusion protein)